MSQIILAFEARLGGWQANVIVFLMAVVMMGLFLIVLPERYQTNQSSDFTNFYEPVAHELLNGHGFQRPDGTPATRYPPGYPVILAGLFAFFGWVGLTKTTGLTLFSLLCMGVGALILFHLAKRLWRPRWAFLTVLAWMTYPLALWTFKQPNSEIPFMVTLYAAAFIFLQTREPGTAWYHLLLLGILTGTAMLIRPIAIGLPIIWLGWEAWHRVNGILLAQRAFFLLLGVLVLVLPWEWWLYRETNQMLLLSSGGTASILDGLTFAVDTDDGRERINVPEPVGDLMRELLTASRSGEMRTMGAILRRLFDESRSDPGAFLGLITVKAARSWYGTDSGRMETLLLVVQIVYMTAILWAGWRTWYISTTHRSYVQLVLILTLYFWFMTVIVLSIVRYMVPIIGLLFVFLPGIFRSGRYPSWKREELAAL